MWDSRQCVRCMAAAAAAPHVIGAEVQQVIGPRAAAPLLRARGCGALCLAIRPVVFLLRLDNRLLLLLLLC